MKLVQSGIKVVDISLMMFFVVSLEQLAGDDWFKGGIAEFEVGEEDLLGLYAEEIPEEASRYYG